METSEEIQTTVSDSAVVASAQNDQDAGGGALGFAAYFIWGLFPLYFVLLRDVPPLVTLAFRAVFTAVVVVPMILCLKRASAIVKTLRNPVYVAGLFVTSATTAASWGFFIWLVAINRATYASLGNYACPLVTIAFASMIFRERLRTRQIAAIILAGIAVLVFARGVGRLPWESVVVALVFAIYSVLRKAMNVDSTTALSVETIFAAPIAVAYIFYAGFVGAERPAWLLSPTTLLLLVGGGALTAIPLLLFGAAARRCRLATLALLNYLTPTGQFICGAVFLHEKTTLYQWLSVALIWVALALSTMDLFLQEKEERRRAATPATVK